MVDVLSLTGKLGLDISGFTAGLGRAQQQLQAASSRMTSIGGAMSLGVTAPLAGLGTAALVSAARVETLMTSFTVLTRSGDTAKTMLADITSFAASTPFEIPELAETARGLLSFGFSAQEIMPRLQELGNLAAGTGQPIQALGTIYGQVATAGRLMGQDMLQLTTRGIPIIEALAQHFGVAKSAIREMVEQGKVGFSDFAETMTGLSTGTGLFAGMMEAQSKTLAGLYSTMKDAIGGSLRTLGEEMVKALDLRAMIGSAISGLEQFGAWLKTVAAEHPQLFKLGLAIAGIAAAAGPVLLALGSLAAAAAALTGALSTGLVASMLAAISGPVGLVALGAAAVAAGASLGLFGEDVETWADETLGTVVLWGKQTAQAISEAVRMWKSAWSIWGEDTEEAFTEMAALWVEWWKREDIDDIADNAMKANAERYQAALIAKTEATLAEIRRLRSTGAAIEIPMPDVRPAAQRAGDAAADAFAGAVVSGVQDPSFAGAVSGAVGAAFDGAASAAKDMSTPIIDAAVAQYKEAYGEITTAGASLATSEKEHHDQLQAELAESAQAEDDFAAATAGASEAQKAWIAAVAEKMRWVKELGGAARAAGGEMERFGESALRQYNTFLKLGNIIGTWASAMANGAIPAIVELTQKGDYAGARALAIANGFQAMADSISRVEVEARVASMAMSVLAGSTLLLATESGDAAAVEEALADKLGISIEQLRKQGSIVDVKGGKMKQFSIQVDRSTKAENSFSSAVNTAGQAAGAASARVARYGEDVRAAGNSAQVAAQQFFLPAEQLPQVDAALLKTAGTFATVAEQAQVATAQVGDYATSWSAAAESAEGASRAIAQVAQQAALFDWQPGTMPIPTTPTPGTGDLTNTLNRGAQEGSTPIIMQMDGETIGRLVRGRLLRTSARNLGVGLA